MSLNDGRVGFESFQLKEARHVPVVGHHGRAETPDYVGHDAMNPMFVNMDWIDSIDNDRWPETGIAGMDIQRNRETITCLQNKHVYRINMFTE